MSALEPDSSTAKSNYPESPFSAPFHEIAPFLGQIARQKSLSPKSQRLRKKSRAIRGCPCLACLQVDCPDTMRPPSPPVIRIRGVAIGRLACRDGQQCNTAQHCRVQCSRPVSFRQHHPATLRMLYQPPACYHGMRCIPSELRHHPGMAFVSRNRRGLAKELYSKALQYTVIACIQRNVDGRTGTGRQLLE
jgi:hypothetical protein